MNIALSLDGVLRGPTGELVQKGLILYRAMKSVGRVILLTELERERAEGWLTINNVIDYDDLIDNSVVVDPAEDLRERQIRVLLSRGPVSLYVEADPARSATGLTLGLSTVLFVESEYSHYAFRPDSSKTVRPWDELVAERTRQQAMIATDKRLRPAEIGEYE